VSQARVTRSFLALGSGDALARLIAFGAAVYVGRTLGPAMYGILTFATGVLLYFKNVTECGIDLLGIRHVAEDHSRIESVAPSLMGTRLAVGIALSVAICLLARFVLPQPDASVFALYSLTLIVIGVDTRWIHLGLHSSRAVAIARTVGELSLLAIVLATVRSEGDLTRVPMAQVLGDVLTAAILFFVLRSMGFRVRPRLDWKTSRPVLARSWPLVANVLLGLTIYNSDLFFLRFLHDTQTVGWYAAAYQLISFLINIASAYSLSLLPALARLASDRGQRDAMHATSTAQTFAVSLPIAVGGCILGPAIIASVFGPEYAPSGPALAILILSIPFTMSKEIDLISLLVSGREQTIMRMTAAAVAVNLTLNLVLIPRYGIPGAAIATVSTEVARAGFARWCAAREGYTWTGWGRRWKIMVASAAMAGALLATNLPFYVELPLGAFVCLAVLALVGGIRFGTGRLPSLHV
jgi:O-antigen/teichoic acid export membrane protein